ncbi:MAG: CatA-like O-acetyltransferase [Pyrinomonadaceae bacterium]
MLDYCLEIAGLRYNLRMPKYLDVSTWARRDLFEFFRTYENPYFNICAQLEITKVLELLKALPGVSASLTYHYFAMRVANEIEPFKYRLRDDQVLVHDVIHGGTTVLLPNESFTFAYFDYQQEFDKFMRDAQAAVNEVRTGSGPFEPLDGDDRIHFTVLPWVSFTSFAHARNKTRAVSVPKIAFGKFIRQNERTFLPVSVEVHHAMMDGLHVGRYFNRLEEMLAEPAAYIGR